MEPGRGDARWLALPFSLRVCTNDGRGELCGRDVPPGAWRCEEGAPPPLCCTESARGRSESTELLFAPEPHRAAGGAREALPFVVVLCRRECASIMPLTAIPETPAAVPTEGTMLPRLGRGITMLARGP